MDPNNYWKEKLKKKSADAIIDVDNNAIASLSYIIEGYTTLMGKTKGNKGNIYCVQFISATCQCIPSVIFRNTS